MKIAGTIYNDCINGPGWRVSIFCSGCDILCPGCHNKAWQKFSYGERLTKEYLNSILTELENNKYSGLSLLGGEPFAKKNIKGMIEIAQACRDKFGDTRDIWIWSGHYLNELKKLGRWSFKKSDREYRRDIKKLLSLCDVLVDGPFLKEKRDIPLKFRGSSNQSIIPIRNLN